jgi:hypothetical protein
MEGCCGSGAEAGGREMRNGTVNVAVLVIMLFWVIPLSPEGDLIVRLIIRMMVSLLAGANAAFIYLCVLDYLAPKAKP